MKLILKSLAFGAILGGIVAGAAVAETRIDAIARHLKSQGYTGIEVSRTWLGRTRIEAYKGTMEREIIVNPRTGEILRDYWEDDDDHHVLGQPEHGDDDGDDVGDDRASPRSEGKPEKGERPDHPGGGDKDKDDDARDDGADDDDSGDDDSDDSDDSDHGDEGDDDDD